MIDVKNWGKNKMIHFAALKWQPMNRLSFDVSIVEFE